MNGDVVHSEEEPPSLPRKVHLVRGNDGYGFNLHGEKGIHGQFISAIDDGSPASQNGMRIGDRVIGVNGEDVEDLPHSKIVEKIRSGGSEVTLVIVDELCDQFYKKIGVKIPQDKFEEVNNSCEAAAAAGANDVEEVNGRQEESVDDATENGGKIGEEKQEQPRIEVQEPEEAPSVPEESGDVVEETATHDEVEDDYEEVVPRKDEVAEEKPIDTPAPVAAVVVPTPKVEPMPKVEPTPEHTTTTTTTTTTNDTSFKFNMTAAEPKSKPKRNEVKKAKVNWKQKHDEFNRL